MSNEPGAPGLTTLGIGAAVVVLQLYLSRRLTRPACRPLRLAAALGAILICTALLLTGHQAQRTRPAKPDTLDALLLRDLPPASVSGGSTRGGEFRSTGRPETRILPPRIRTRSL